MPLTDHQREFLRRLADLCAEFSAGFGYTTSDDGTHVTMAGEDVFVGYLDESAAAQLREASEAYRGN